MKFYRVLFVGGGVLVLALSGCAEVGDFTRKNPNTVGGAALGTVGGAVVGSAFGAPAVGAGLGGAIGGAIGHGMDSNDKPRTCPNGKQPVYDKKGRFVRHICR